MGPCDEGGFRYFLDHPDIHISIHFKLVQDGGAFEGLQTFDCLVLRHDDEVMPDLSRPSPTIACVIFQKNDTHYLNVMEDGIYIDTSDFTLEVRLSNKYAKPSLSILEYFMAPDDDEDEPPSPPPSLERTTVSLLENLLDQRSDMLTFLEFKVKVLAGLSALEDTVVEKDQKIAALEKQLQEKKEADDAHIIKRLDSLEHKMDMLLSSKDDDAEGECAPDYPKGRVRVCANWNGKPDSCRAGESCVYAHPMGCVMGDEMGTNLYNVTE